MKTIKIILLLLVTAVVINSCKKDDGGIVPNEEHLDPVDDELNTLLSLIPSDTSINTLDLKFDDGSSIIDFIQQNDPNFLNEHNVFKTSNSLTPEQQKKLLIGRMSLAARSFVIRNNWKNVNGSNQPNGLAYNWGSKNHKVAQKPAKYKENPNKCQDKLFGLDCSGMIYQMALNAGINLAQGGASAEFERNTANWNNNFRQSTIFKDLKANLYKHTGVPSTDPSYININGLKEGDLIFKTNNGKAVHVGMILRVDLNDPKSLSIYQSNGKPDMSCDVNKSDKCGPRIISFSSEEAFGSGTLFGIDWQVVRFEAGGCDNLPTITDPRDGKTYQTVQIGSQTWFAENLRYSGSIPQVIGDADWAAGQSAWCYYDNNAANDATYGKLYNWYAVNSTNVCPAGWHVPTDAEWTQLTDYLGGTQIAGGKMKNTTGWNAPNTSATNESCFSGAPGGGRDGGGLFVVVGSYGYWWSSTQNGNGAWQRYLDYSNGGVVSYSVDKKLGVSVRCVRD